MFWSDTPLVRSVFIISKSLTLDWFWSKVMLSCFHLNPGMGSQFGLFVFRMVHSSEMLRNTPNVWYGLKQASIYVVRQASIFVVRQLVWSARQAVCRCLACHLWDDIVTPPFFCLCYRLHLHSSTMLLPIESSSFSQVLFVGLPCFVAGQVKVCFCGFVMVFSLPLDSRFHNGGLLMIAGQVSHKVLSVHIRCP